ncbi:MULTISPECIES: M23 family metallopeptidase [Paraburkholderia]|jgi:murein DD-endopeptidase MepM/ murein hydrolase activator NlpD|uniref:M23 family metallopeptidase n=1 Tax=Paraburkholderia TaxID=1822464 RepID=UPI001CADF1D7|nr:MULTISPECIES: M23 family metallopeptidase [Paraburkholderia]BEU27242.1 M23 family metallopeptidase [Paraburkholderia sp. 22B1P]GJH01126.1 peptidoglycan DD-metalloendopeptidase family protein [Paraburkholderia terrae]GJH36192.1 peptidoglycan DD-metalloendopeptidase family protein [Paraburkholderia hospita]CAG9248191.1 Membrane protein related to metalloendopeptidase [Paraburkholderia caribensis]
MPFPAFVAPSARSGKVILVCAVSSVCAALIFSPNRAKHAADQDDAAGAQSASLNREAVDTTRHAQPASPASAAEAAPQPVVRSATVKSSFAEAAQRLGLDGRTTALLAHAFSGEIDFHRDLKPGNTISLVVDPPEAEATAQAPSTTPLAVRIATGTTSHDLFLYRNLDGKPFYYTKDGASTTPTFTRYPLAYERVSSDFALHRLDPVTHRWQSHDGVDLAAPAGTPVHATARGTVAFIGRQTGYGKVVVLRNPPPYQTVFAHLSRFAKGLHRGAQVHRGQVIGYVGSTGWATGPHLHYEVHVDSVPKDPLTVALPGNNPLDATERAQFAKDADRLAALL